MLRRIVVDSLVNFRPGVRSSLRCMSTIKLIPFEYVANDQITLYIKGFLSKGETIKDFKKWTDSHKIMTDRHGWGELAKGWSWDCGQINYPYPIASGLHIANAVYNGSKILRLNPVSLIAGLAVDSVIFSSRLAYQYKTTEHNTIELANKLSADIIKLSDKYERVRIIAHSLGCKLLMNAIKKTPEESRPTTIHLFGPAFGEEEFEDVYEKAARYRTYVYYSENDYALGVLLQFIKSHDIVGAHGFKRVYDNVSVKDVTNHFKDFWFVHNSYNKEFPHFIERENS